MSPEARKRSTGIEWTEHTWNPFVGCSIHTAGCTNCYAMPQAARIARMNPASVYEGTTKRAGSGRYVWTGTIRRATDETWQKPLRMRAPSMFFVNSMSDFFHEGAPDDWRTEALAIMARTPHQYQILTKRPEHIAGYLARTGVAFPVNAWIGTTVERADFKHRIDTLRAIPARVRFLSLEPLLGPLGRLDLTGIHWVIVGGESGPGARAMHADWVREIIEQCVAQGVAVFFKQWGIPQNNPLWTQAIAAGLEPGLHVALNDGNGKGGSSIDGREWKQYRGFEAQQVLL